VPVFATFACPSARSASSDSGHLVPPVFVFFSVDFLFSRHLLSLIFPLSPMRPSGFFPPRDTLSHSPDSCHRFLVRCPLSLVASFLFPFLPMENPLTFVFISGSNIFPVNVSFYHFRLSPSYVRALLSPFFKIAVSPFFRVFAIASCPLPRRHRATRQSFGFLMPQFWSFLECYLIPEHYSTVGSSDASDTMRLLRVPASRKFFPPPP